MKNQSRRDPRIDPRAGDVLRRIGAKTGEREVLSVGAFSPGGRIGVLYPTGYRDYRWVDMEMWRQWAAKAEVIDAAE